VAIRYGRRPDASLSSSPRLYSDDKDLVITPPGGGREQPVEGTILGIKRSVEECRHLAELAAGLPAGSDCLALLDGTLILWGLEAYPEFVTDFLLDNGLLKCLGGRDRDLFMNLLEIGERSALFVSPSKIVRERYGEHRVCFFYLKVDDEIARIEIPQWVAESELLLNLTHGLVLDQCRRGYGYPVVLSEGHEQAVVTGADRENFWELVESSLVAEHLPSPGSAKSFSKRTRWV